MEEEPVQKKRRRILQEETLIKEANVYDIPEHLLVTILSFLPFEDLNEVAQVSKCFCKVRNNPFLDQTRAGTIDISSSHDEEVTEDQIARKFEKWKALFQGNRTHLRLICGQNDEDEDVEDLWYLHYAYWWGKTGLSSTPLVNILSLEFRVGKQYGSIKDYERDAFRRFLPNLKEVDLDGCALQSYDSFPFSTKVNFVVWRDAPIHAFVSVTGRVFSDLHETMDLYLDGSFLYTGHSMDDPFLSNCRNVVRRVSIMDVTFFGYDANDGYRISYGDASDYFPFILEFVEYKNSPNLEWFCSSLSNEELSRLKLVRPDVVFTNN